MSPQAIEDVSALVGEVSGPASPMEEYLCDLDLERLEHDSSLAGFVAQAETMFKTFFEECGFMSSLRDWKPCLVTLLLAPAGERAEAERELAGFVIYKHWGPPVRTMTLLRVAVDPKYARLGYGRQLVKIVEDRARALPVQACGEVSLCALPEVVGFYRKMRYVEDARSAMCSDTVASASCDGLPGSVFMRRKCVRARGSTRQSRRR